MTCVFPVGSETMTVVDTVKTYLNPIALWQKGTTVFRVMAIGVAVMWVFVAVTVIKFIKKRS